MRGSQKGLNGRTVRCDTGVVDDVTVKQQQYLLVKHLISVFHQSSKEDKERYYKLQHSVSMQGIVEGCLAHLLQTGLWTMFDEEERMPLRNREVRPCDSFKGKLECQCNSPQQYKPVGLYFPSRLLRCPQIPDETTVRSILMHVYTLEGVKNSGDVEAPIILLLSDDQVQN